MLGMNRVSAQSKNLAYNIEYISSFSVIPAVRAGIYYVHRRGSRIKSGMTFDRVYSCVEWYSKLDLRWTSTKNYVSREERGEGHPPRSYTATYAYKE